MGFYGHDNGQKREVDRREKGIRWRITAFGRGTERTGKEEAEAEAKARARQRKKDDVRDGEERKVRFTAVHFTVEMVHNSHNRESSTTTPTNPKLLPVPVLPYAPVRQDERQHYLKLLHDQYLSCSRRHADGASSADIVRKSVQSELAVAKTSKSKMQYQHSIKMLMFNLKKHGTEDGKQRKAAVAAAAAAPSSSVPASATAPVDHLKELSDLCIPLQRLKRHNYVLDIPSLPSPDYSLPKTVDCSHCGVKFNIAEISKPVSCTFHPGKLQTSTYNNFNKGKKVYGTDYTNRFHSCCSETKGQSNGCKKLDHHVYKFNSPVDLHLSKPFWKINAMRSSLQIKDDSKAQLLRKEKIKAVGIDCEMCYTDKGFEMMKLSVVDFRTEKKLLDSIIHPDGDLIIDLNTHVSGVSEIPQSALTFDEAMIKLAQLTDEDTIIVGHGLENDLNVLRLIYPRIVDTAILFSENQVDVRRKDPLKKLAWSFLSENIQGREHDSLEDAIVPIRIVKKHLERLHAKKLRNNM